MPFDYDKAMLSVRQELEQLVSSVFPAVERNCQEIIRKGNVQDRYFAVSCNLRFLEEADRKIFLLLNALNTERYHDAITHWLSIGTLSEEHKEECAKIIIRQAENDTRTAVGNLWIVMHYDSLKQYTESVMLAQYVNKGFWDFANEYLAVPICHGFSIPWQYYQACMKHSNLLDFARAEEFKGKPLLAQTNWPDKTYADLFEIQKHLLSAEEGARLARPLIEQTINTTLSWNEPVENPQKELEKELQKYSAYLNTPTIQELFREEIEKYAEMIGYLEQRIWSVERIKLLRNYWKVDECLFKDTVSNHLPKRNDLPMQLVYGEFPGEWLNASAYENLQEQTKEILKHPVKSEIVPHLIWLQAGIKAKLLSENILQEHLKECLGRYLSSGRRPSGESIETMIRFMKPEYVDNRLYSSVLEQGIKDLVLRKRTGTARNTYAKHKTLFSDEQQKSIEQALTES